MNLKYRKILLFCVIFSLYGVWRQQDQIYVDFDSSSNVQNMVFGAYGKQDCSNYAYMKELWQNNNPACIQPSEKLLIPKISFHIWLGGPMPTIYKKFVQSWVEKHSTWHHIFCVDNPENYQLGYKVINSFEQLDDCLADQYSTGTLTVLDIRLLPLMTAMHLNRSKNFAQQSDVLRYEFLYRYGGVYADTDMLCVKPFDGLHQRYTFYIGLANTSTVEIGNSIMGSMPRHPILKRMLELLQIPESVNTMDDILNSTGPRFVTKIVLDCTKENSERIGIFPCSYFFPTPQWARIYTEKQMNTFIKPESFSNHYWECSWWKSMRRQ